MKKYTTLVLGLTAVFALAACNNGKGKEVKEEEFKEKASKVEEHQYTEATLKYSYSEEYKIPNTGPLFGDDDDTGPLDDEDNETGPLNDKDSGKGEAKFTLKDGKWTSDDKEALNGFGYMIGLNIKDADLADINAEFGGVAEEYGVKVTVKYYVDPLGIEIKAKEEIQDNSLFNMKGTVDIYAYLSFDKYGFITKLDAKSDIKYTTKISEQEYETIMFSEMNATISYK